MGTINSARAKLGLQATGTPTSTNVSGLQRVGEWPSTQSLAGADIAYSFKVDDDGGAFGVTLDLASGVVSVDSGSPVVSDGDGKDFEGDTLPTAVKLYSVYFTFDTADAGGSFAVSSTNAALPDIPATQDGATTSHQYVVAEGVTGTLGTITVDGTPGLGSYSFTATIVASST